MRNYERDDDRRAAKKASVGAWGIGVLIVAMTAVAWVSFPFREAAIFTALAVAGIVALIVSYRSVVGKN
jgi:hypothetical protein